MMVLRENTCARAWQGRGTVVRHFGQLGLETFPKGEVCVGHCRFKGVVAGVFAVAGVLQVAPCQDCGTVFEDFSLGLAAKPVFDVVGLELIGEEVRLSKAVQVGERADRILGIVVPVLHYRFPNPQ